MIAYSDYEGPQGTYAVIDGKVLPALDDDVIEALAQNAMLLSAGAAHAVELASGGSELAAA